MLPHLRDFYESFPLSLRLSLRPSRDPPACRPNTFLLQI